MVISALSMVISWWLFKHGLLEDTLLGDFSIETSISRGFSIDKFDYQRVPVFWVLNQRWLVYVCIMLDTWLICFFFLTEKGSFFQDLRVPIWTCWLFPFFWWNLIATWEYNYRHLPVFGGKDMLIQVDQCCFRLMPRSQCQDNGCYCCYWLATSYLVGEINPYDYLSCIPNIDPKHRKYVHVVFSYIARLIIKKVPMCKETCVCQWYDTNLHVNLGYVVFSPNSVATLKGFLR